MLSFLGHRRACAAKQKERDERIRSLPPEYHTPLSLDEERLLAHPVSEVVAAVQAGTLYAPQVLLAYSKKALEAHAATNCLTEVFIARASREPDGWARTCNTQGPLAGMPVSLKDTVGVAGEDACIGYSAWVGKPVQKDAAIVRLLRDAGAVPFVKTNVPITLLSFESANDVFGTTTNPHNKAYSPGGSTGGEAALLAYGGSRIGIGTDVAGSVRAPAHFSGVYSVKASMHRFLRTGNVTSMPGQEGIPATYSPMARTLEDLETFWKAIFTMKPWEYDHSVLPIPWREVDLASGKPIRWGVLWDDGVVTPSPACRRALETVVSELKSRGHEVVPMYAPETSENDHPYEGLKLGSQLIWAEGAKLCTRPIRWGETNDPGVQQARLMFAMPRFVKSIYAWYLRHIRKDEIYAGLVEGCSEKTTEEYLGLIAQREAYRDRWFQALRAEAFDFILTVPNALPATPHKGMKDGLKGCGYTFLWNILDYSAGVMPVTHVDKELDALGKFKSRNAVERDMYKMYDVEKMHGLPVGVQVVGKRLEEEKVLEGMKLIEGLLRDAGKAYTLLDPVD